MSDYRVRPDEEFIEPEETLMDSRSNLSKIERPVSGSVFNFLVLFFGIILVLYLVNLMNLQIFSGDRLKEIALQNISLSYTTPALRGVIYDRQGKELAYSVPDFELVVIPKQIPKNKNGLDNFKQILSKTSGISIDSLENTLNLQKNNALIIFQKEIEKSKAIQVSQAKLPGVFIIPKPKRIYADGNYFSHIIGYINQVSDLDLEKDEYYKLQDKIGRSGLEANYEEILRGTHGLVNFSKESSGNDLLGSKPGDSLVVNIDFDVQKKLYESLNTTLRSVGLTRGAAIVQNPNNGAVIGMVSFPSYDNNIFQEELTLEDFKNNFSDRNKPLLNRAIGGTYSPGSTIKPLLALAGLKEGVITSNTTITDNKGYITIRSQFDPNVIYTYRDWKIQGTVDLKKAIANSSDIYFYSVGGGYGNISGLGISRLATYFKEFLIDQILDIDLPGEKSGFIPTEAWKLTAKGEAWYKGDTFNVSIGQGDLLVTPLWLNTYVSAIANGGVLFKPQVVNKIVNPDKKTVEIFPEEEMGHIDFSQDIINEVKIGMREVVVSGTGQLLSNLPVPVAAKTGTTEVIKGKTANSLVLVFGPYPDPEITLTVIIEGIEYSQQGLALRAAKDFLEWYFNKSRN